MRAIQYLTLLFFLLVVTTVFGQELQVPNTPAFSILGYEPTSVMRPSSVKKLSNDILNSFDKDGNVLMNLGMEVSPYWLKSRPDLSREKYLNPTPFQAFLQTLSISAATVKDTVSKQNNLGFGFRLQVVKGKLTEDFHTQEAALKNYETAIAAIGFTRSLAVTFTTLDEAIQNIEDNLKGAALPNATIVILKQKAMVLAKKYDNNTIKEFCEALIESLEPDTNALAEKVILLANKRVGFSLEFAGASKFISTKASQDFQKAGFWVNANNYFTEQDAWTITGRILTTVNDTLTVNSDLGFGYIKQGNDYNVSIEGMLRWYRSEIPDVNTANEAITRLEKKFTYRLAAQISYTIMNHVSANFSLGKDFEDAKLKGSSFFSIFGLNYSIFNKREELAALK